MAPWSRGRASGSLLVGAASSMQSWLPPLVLCTVPLHGVGIKTLDIAIQGPKRPLKVGLERQQFPAKGKSSGRAPVTRGPGGGAERGGAAGG